MTDIDIHVAEFAALDTPTLYALLKLRVDVFVVEQDCPYPELDGRDTEPATRHIWATRNGRLVGYLRVLDDVDGAARIGRVCTTVSGRGGGVAGRLMERALHEVAGRPVVLDAQSYLVDFYRRYGFSPCGAEFVEDGIGHVPMSRLSTGTDPA